MCRKEINLLVFRTLTPSIEFRELLSVCLLLALESRWLLAGAGLRNDSWDSMENGEHVQLMLGARAGADNSTFWSTSKSTRWAAYTFRKGQKKLLGISITASWIYRLEMWVWSECTIVIMCGHQWSLRAKLSKRWFDTKRAILLEARTFWRPPTWVGFLKTNDTKCLLDAMERSRYNVVLVNKFL